MAMGKGRICLAQWRLTGCVNHIQEDPTPTSSWPTQKKLPGASADLHFVLLRFSICILQSFGLVLIWGLIGGGGILVCCFFFNVFVCFLFSFARKREKEHKVYMEVGENIRKVKSMDKI